MTAATDASLPGPVIEAAVGAVAPGGQALRQLALALSADPGALAKGAPPIAGKLAAALIARGSAVLAVPECTACGRTGKPLLRGDAGSAVCQRCRSWQLAVACAGCGKVRRAPAWTAPAAGLRGVLPQARSEAPPCVRPVRRDLADRGPRPGREPGHLRELLQHARRRLRRLRQAEGMQLRLYWSSRLYIVLPAGDGGLRPVRSGPPAGPRDRSAIRATSPRCATGAGALPAGSSGGWSPRPAREPTPALTAPGSRLRTRARTAALKTSSTRKACAPGAACAAARAICCRPAQGASHRSSPASWRRSPPPASRAAP